MLVKVAIPKQIQFKIVPNLPDMLLYGQQEVHYIGGSEVLPPPLEPEEEAKAIENLEGKYEKEARTMLIEHNLRLVVYIAKKFDNTGVGVEDLISIGTIGLIKAINTFNKEKNIKLATYASRCIENEILMYLRRNSKTRLEVSIDEPLNVDWDGVLNITMKNCLKIWVLAAVETTPLINPAEITSICLTMMLLLIIQILISLKLQYLF